MIASGRRRDSASRISSHVLFFANRSCNSLRAAFWSGQIGECVIRYTGHSPLDFRAGVCSPLLAASDRFAAIQASFRIAFLDADSKNGVGRMGHIDDVTNSRFRFAFHVLPRNRCLLLPCSMGFSIRVHALVDMHHLCVPHRTKQNGRPAENGRLPAL